MAWSALVVLENYSSDLYLECLHPLHPLFTGLVGPALDRVYLLFVALSGLVVLFIVLCAVVFVVYSSCLSPCIRSGWFRFGSCIKTCPGTISDEPGIWTLIQLRLRVFLVCIYIDCYLLLQLEVVF
ncbi:hypothetical protein Hanom_Chr08g00745061 [Helianthus anomalus]